MKTLTLTLKLLTKSPYTCSSTAQNFFKPYKKKSVEKERNQIPVANIGKASISLMRRKVKGTVSRDFLLQVFFMNHLPPSP
jgi:hypothetical protein